MHICHYRLSKKTQNNHCVMPKIQRDSPAKKSSTTPAKKSSTTPAKKSSTTPAKNKHTCTYIHSYTGGVHLLSSIVIASKRDCNSLIFPSNFSTTCACSSCSWRVRGACGDSSPCWSNDEIRSLRLRFSCSSASRRR